MDGYFPLPFSFFKGLCLFPTVVWASAGMGGFVLKSTTKPYPFSPRGKLGEVSCHRKPSLYVLFKKHTELHVIKIEAL